MVGYGSPGLTTIQQGREDNCLEQSHFVLGLDSFLIREYSAQAVETTRYLADARVNLLVKATVC